MLFLKKILNNFGTTKTDLDIDLKMKISRIKYLESKLLWLNNLIQWKWLQYKSQNIILNVTE